MTTHLYLHHLDGREFAHTLFPPGVPRSVGAAWNWCAECVAFEFECGVDDVGCAETEDDELVTVRGEPVARYSVIYVDNVRPRA